MLIILSLWKLFRIYFLFTENEDRCDNLDLCYLHRDSPADSRTGFNSLKYFERVLIL